MATEGMLCNLNPLCDGPGRSFRFAFYYLACGLFSAACLGGTLGRRCGSSSSHESVRAARSHLQRSIWKWIARLLPANSKWASEGGWPRTPQQLRHVRRSGLVVCGAGGRRRAFEHRVSVSVGGPAAEERRASSSLVEPMRGWRWCWCSPAGRLPACELKRFRPPKPLEPPGGAAKTRRGSRPEVLVTQGRRHLAARPPGGLVRTVASPRGLCCGALHSG